MAVVVTKGYMIKAHVAFKRYKFAIWLLPCPLPGLLTAGNYLAIFIFYICKANFTFIYFRLKRHRIKYTLGAGQCRKKKITLLSKLIYRHGRLAYKHQVACQAAYVRHIAQRHNSAQHRHNSIIYVRYANYCRNHSCRITLCAGAGLAELVVLASECF